METFESVINWLASGAGAVIAAAWMASWLLEDWQKWTALRPKAKKLWILAVSAVLGLAGTGLRENPALLEALTPYLNTLTLVGVAWLSTQIAHKTDKNTEPYKLEPLPEDWTDKYIPRREVE